MMKALFVVLSALFLLSACHTDANADDRGVDRFGCHTNYWGGGYHCHVKDNADKTFAPYVESHTVETDKEAEE